MQSTLLVNAGTLCCVIAAGYLVLSPAVIEPGGSLPTISPGLNQRAPVGEVKSAEAEDRECRDKLRQVGVVATTSTCPEGLDAIVAGLNKGRYWFNKLDVAHVAEAFPLTLKLQTSPDQIISFEGLPGTVEKSEPLRWARNLEATLSGDDFEILPSAPQQRSVTGAQPVEWNWTVKPKAAGKKMLTVEVAANIMVGPEKHRVQLKMLYRPIEIKVTTFQWVKGFAAEVYGFLGALAGLATLLATLIAFVPKLRGFLKEEFNLFRGLATPAQTVVPPDISEKGPLE